MKRISLLILSLLIAQSQALYCNVLIDNMGALAKLFEAGAKTSFVQKDTQNFLMTLVLCTYLVKFGHNFMKNNKITRARQKGFFSEESLDVACGSLALTLLAAMTANATIKYKKSLTRATEESN